MINQHLKQAFYILTFTGLGLLSIQLHAQEQTLTPQAFAQKAAISNTFEIEAAKLVVERGKDPSARTFAKDMITDHERAGVELAQAARGEKFQLKAGLDNEHREKLEAIKASPDENFDQAYLSTQVSAHEAAVALFAKYTQQSTGGPLKAFTEKTLGTLRAHDVRIHGLTKE
ncbi:MULTISPECIES: DUF4142 domain-containing protein [unclassified Rhizobium]|uniref:DUF4142 domain-containing protein n=1 Tax=unclassified Rhizobium TaxID=2613769 RepID=UPI0007127351|nr:MULTISPECIES: DUF4142 domain-containing protein [unclassified Rhizobium]KQS88535.1 hypothetical protein ASG50_28230 [Rhizobium sp. Leaf386]KQS95769.1 hypothetical protein ASG42_29060 [Rhizobium sp. Leaf391]KQU05971.1 hypothetical protein ASG68_24750 [Rhizobium sp. Leaf453]